MPDQEPSSTQTHTGISISIRAQLPPSAQSADPIYEIPETLDRRGVQKCERSLRLAVVRLTSSSPPPICCPQSALASIFFSLISSSRTLNQHNPRNSRHSHSPIPNQGHHRSSSRELRCSDNRARLEGTTSDRAASACRAGKQTHQLIGVSYAPPHFTTQAPTSHRRTYARLGPRQTISRKHRDSLFAKAATGTKMSLDRSLCGDTSRRA
jgi:hypothetical protein